MDDPSRIGDTILRMAEARGLISSIWPGKVARARAPDWRRLTAAIRLAQAGRIEIQGKGRAVGSAGIAQAGVKGAARLRVRPGLDA